MRLCLSVRPLAVTALGIRLDSRGVGGPKTKFGRSIHNVVIRSLSLNSPTG